MTVGHKIIVEGVDGAGKSHYIEEFLKDHPDYRVIHCSRHTPNTFEYFKELLLSPDNLILDRGYIGQFIYQTSEDRILRNWMILEDLAKLESIVSEYSFSLVYVYTKPEVAFHICHKDKEDSYYTLDYIINLMNRYEFFFDHISSIQPTRYFNDYTPEDMNTVYESEEPIDYKGFDYDSLPKVVAVDFDGTLVYGKPFPEIGTLNKKLIYDLYEGKYKDYKKILFTHRSHNALIDACNFCADNGLYFDAVNDDIPEIKKALKRNPIDNRKVWFDVLIDDKVDISAIPNMEDVK